MVPVVPGVDVPRRKSRDGVGLTRLYSGGRIVTCDPSRPRAGAVLTVDNRITAVADRPEEIDLPGGPIERIDLAGRTLVPGFNDNHIHAHYFGNQEGSLQLGGLTKQEILDRVRAALAQPDAPSPLLAFRWDYPSCPDPHRRDLDAISTDHPIILVQFSGHGAWLNTAMLRRLKMLPGQRYCERAEVLKDEAGEPTGIVRELSRFPSFRGMWFRRSMNSRRLEHDFLIALDRLRHAGITSIQDNTWFPPTVPALRRILRRGELTARVQMWSFGELRPMGAWMRIRRDLPPWFVHGPQKFFLDGAFSSHSAWLTEPYADLSHTEYGAGRDAAAVRRYLEPRVRRRQRTAQHSIGDRATKEFLDAVEALAPRYPWIGAMRLRIEHGQLIRSEDIERMARLGVIVCAQPNALIDPAKDESLLGHERALRAYPYRSLLDAGVALSFGSDYPGELTYEPLTGIHLAVNRDGPERISAAEALACYTRGSAYAEFMEHEKGMVRPGLLSDFAVLSEDPTTCPPQRIRDIRVEMTVVDGRTVFERTADDGSAC